MATAYFPPALFTFLKRLARNNDRDWFLANKPRFEADVRAPAQKFITDFARPLAKISGHFVADPRPVGGSMFRINRDIRFGKDKRPYKTNLGIQFRHRKGKDAHAPGFYLHLEPGRCFAGAGIWHPDPKTARLIREAIVADPRRWKRATRGKSFAGRFELTGDSLVRPPKGLDPEHPLLEDLKRKDFIAVADLTQKALTSPTFLADYTKLCRTAAPLMGFLAEAVGVEF